MNFSAFFSYTFLTAYTPGTNNIMSMTNASRDGMKRTLPFLAGITTGFIVVMAACAAFSSLLSVIGASGCLCWAVSGAAFEKLFNKYRKALNLIMALLLAYCAVSLFL